MFLGHFVARGEALPAGRSSVCGRLPGRL